VIGRRLDKPLPTGSKRTLDVERSKRADASTQRDFGHGEQEPPGKKAQAIQPLEGQGTSGRDVT